MNSTIKTLTEYCYQVIQVGGKTARLDVNLALTLLEIAQHAKPCSMQGDNPAHQKLRAAIKKLEDTKKEGP